MLKLVPFNPIWVENKSIDIHAIYRRPRFVEDAYGEWHREYDANGLPTWDLTTGLPVRSHTRWTSKGFQYVTLADRDSLAIAAKKGTLLAQDGQSPASFADYNQHHTGGPWNYRKYAEGQQQFVTAAEEKLKADVEKYGWKTVEEIRQQTEPHFKVPEHLKAEPKRDAGTFRSESDIGPVTGFVGRITQANASAELAVSDPSLQPERRKRGRPKKSATESVA